MLHYAYGSNLSYTFLKGYYCPSAKFVMKASLPNFRVEFRFLLPEMSDNCNISRL